MILKYKSKFTSVLAVFAACLKSETFKNESLFYWYSVILYLSLSPLLIVLILIIFLSPLPFPITPLCHPSFPVICASSLILFNVWNYSYSVPFHNSTFYHVLSISFSLNSVKIIFVYLFTVPLSFIKFVVILFKFVKSFTTKFLPFHFVLISFYLTYHFAFFTLISLILLIFDAYFSMSNFFRTIN
jgi:hypothetical protein